jgi:UDP-N-acetylmuramate--alanine ligase
MIGIGGIGMSALAQYLRHYDVAIDGSDVSSNTMTSFLVDTHDINIAIGNPSTLPSNTYDAVVYSPAVPENNHQRIYARKHGIPEYSYPEVLGMISRNKPTITVSGTNGKTTTTTMIIELLQHFGADPEAIVGERLQLTNSNYVPGQGNYFVAEACEYKNSFHHINWNIAVVTNISLDHLDYFKDLEHIQESFVQYLSNAKDKNATLVLNKNLPNIAPLCTYADIHNINVIDYSRYLPLNTPLRIPGEHNKENAAAALAVIDHLGYDIHKARAYLQNSIRGAKRRFEYIGQGDSGALVYDDYAHNPEGLTHLINGLREIHPNDNIVIIFEPHLYSRTRDMKEAFGKALSLADEVYLLPTYRAREEYNEKENFLLKDYISHDIPVHCIDNEEPYRTQLQEKKEGTVIVSAGAGTVTHFGHSLVYKKPSH